MDEAQAENDVVDAERETTKAQQGQDWRFQCGVCEEKLPRGVFNQQKETPSVYHLYSKLIAAGYWWTCMACSKKARDVKNELECSF